MFSLFLYRGFPEKIPSATWDLRDRQIVSIELVYTEVPFIRNQLYLLAGTVRMPPQDFLIFNLSFYKLQSLPFYTGSRNFIRKLKYFFESLYNCLKKISIKTQSITVRIKCMPHFCEKMFFPHLFDWSISNSFFRSIENFCH